MGSSSSSGSTSEAARRAAMEREMARQSQYAGLTLEQMYAAQNALFMQSYGMGAEAGPRPVPPEVKPTTVAIRNDVHCNKSNIRLVPAGGGEGLCVEATIDAATPCAVTIFFCVTLVDSKTDSLLDKITCTREYSVHRTVLPAGTKQLFSQVSTADAFNMSLFTREELCPAERAPTYFPIVILLESVGESEVGSVDRLTVGPAGLDMRPRRSYHCQMTTATLEYVPTHSPQYIVKPIGQKLQIAGKAYFLDEIYGISARAGGSSAASTAPAAGSSIEDDSGTDCVVCLTEPRSTVVLPCRHMCLCAECANKLRFQTNKCPICRNPIQSLQEIGIATTSGESP